MSSSDDDSTKSSRAAAIPAEATPPASKKPRTEEEESESIDDGMLNNPFIDAVDAGHAAAGAPTGDSRRNFTVEEEIYILREAIRQGANAVDSDRWRNPFYRYLNVLTTAVERLTTDLLNARAELRSIRQTLAVCVATQDVFDARNRAFVHAILPHVFLPHEADPARVIDERYPNITPVFRSDMDYQAHIAASATFAARLEALERQFDRMNTQVSRMHADMYEGGAPKASLMLALQHLVLFRLILKANAIMITTWLMFPTLLVRRTRF